MQYIVELKAKHCNVYSILQCKYLKYSEVLLLLLIQQLAHQWWWIKSELIHLFAKGTLLLLLFFFADMSQIKLIILVREDFVKERLTRCQNGQNNSKQEHLTG